MTRSWTVAVLAGLVAVVAACSDEAPTSLGVGVVDPGFRTYEIVLSAGAFLLSDTTYDQIGSIHVAPFGLVANDFEGELHARTLFRISLPETVSWEDEDGTTQRDSVFTVVGGNLTVVMDTFGTATPVMLEVVEVTESWDPGSVTWQLRSDTAGDEPWQQPGGTTGRVLGSITQGAGDTITIALDSAAAAVWTDSAAAFNGGLLRTTTEGVRLRVQTLRYAFDVRPASADTVVPAGSAFGETFVVTPDPPAAPATELRVGGVPTWRSVLQFRPLEDLRIPCAPDSSAGCTLPLPDATVNLAAVLLQPMEAGSRRIERPYRVEARGVLRAPGVPLSRSPLTNPFGRMSDPVSPGLFLDPFAAVPAAIPITSYVRQALSLPEDQDPVRWLALITEDESQAPVFGYGAYGSLQSAAPPRLRLVVTAPVEGVGR